MEEIKNETKENQKSEIEEIDSNILDIFVTFEVLKLDIFKLTNRKQASNIPLISVTL